MELRLRRSSLLGLLILACCTSILAAEFGDRRANAQRSERQSSQQLQRVRLPRRLSSRHNELASTESSRKTSQHMLIGGHLRTEPAESTTAETSVVPSRQQADSTLEDGLLLSSAGAGKDKKSSTTSSDDDDKKTLAQQVKEGKYGLLQNELFSKRPKRPGILSYSSNSEVPRDTLKNLGGLDEDEIWLAENHLLVLKGGNFREAGDEAPGELHSSDDVSWPPIDDYKAPRRQVKIPPRPKVPPPFPVQLIEGGPVQLIGTNGTSFAAENDTIDFEALPGGFRGFLPGEGPYFSLSSNGTDLSPERRTKSDDSVDGRFYPALPPGAVIVPPPSNQTDYDEDQSIYYPPPYSFVYPQSNSTDIPPGPLVPGIILPPPPDFFSAFDDLGQRPAKDKYAPAASPSKRPSSTTPLPPVAVSRPASFLPPRKSSTKLYKTPATAVPKLASYRPKPFSRAKAKNASTVFQRYRTEKTSAAPPTYQTLPFVEVTTPLPVKTTTLESPERFHIQSILGNQVVDTSTEKPWKSPVSTEKSWKSHVSSKPVPLLTFYASTTPSSVDEPIETTPAAALVVKNVGLTTEDPTSRYPSQASYYFYEEAGNEAPPPSSTPAPVLFFSTTAETPPYYKLDVPEQPGPPEEERKDYYNVQSIPSRQQQQQQQQQQQTKDYNIKLIDSIVKDPQIYKYLDSGATTSNQEKFETSPIRSQSPRMLHSEPLYYQPVPTRSSPRLSYFTTPKPKSYYDHPKIGADSLYGGDTKSNAKSKPIYQYSFEAASYKRNHQPEIREPVSIYEAAEPPQIPTPRRQKEVSLFNEYQDIQTVGGGDQYSDYEIGEAARDESKLSAYQPPQPQPQPQPQPRKKERAYYSPQSTTAVPIRATTLAGHQQYFTKQDEQLLDDVTKEYFTMFGKKLAGRQLPSTTPIYGKSSVTERPQKTYNANSYVQQQQQQQPPPAPSPFHAANIRVHYGDATPGPYSLKDDVLVNYKQPLPPINPDAEFINVVTPSPASVHNRYRPPAVVSHVRDYSPPFVTARPPSLEGDIAVNYKPQRPPINPDAEFIAPNKPNSYFAYQLPGDGGHFYFLTPQAISRQEQPSGYLSYSRPSRASRPLPRRRRARDHGD